MHTNGRICPTLPTEWSLNYVLIFIKPALCFHLHFISLVSTSMYFFTTEEVASPGVGRSSAINNMISAWDKCFFSSLYFLIHFIPSPSSAFYSFLCVPSCLLYIKKNPTKPLRQCTKACWLFICGRWDKIGMSEGYAPAQSWLPKEKKPYHCIQVGEDFESDLG